MSHTSELLFLVGEQEDNGDSHTAVPGGVSEGIVRLRLGKRKDTHTHHGKHEPRQQTDETMFWRITTLRAMTHSHLHNTHAARVSRILHSTEPVLGLVRKNLIN